LKVKSLGLAILLAFVFSLSTAFGQSPEKRSYQAVICDVRDNLVTDQQTGMQISILQVSAGGTAVYAETQEPTTNANGFDTRENDYNMRVLPKFFGIKTSDRNIKIINT
jgi:hypothetical protein